MIFVPCEFRNESHVIPIRLSRARLVKLDKLSVDLKDHLITEWRSVGIGPADLKLATKAVTGP
jgi:hypothetical protein